MAMRTCKVTITGVTPLLQNNPQTVDRFNKFARRMAQINAKKTRSFEFDLKSSYDKFCDAILGKMKELLIPEA